jgi:hypothetical protein
VKFYILVSELRVLTLPSDSLLFQQSNGPFLGIN